MDLLPSPDSPWYSLSRDFLDVIEETRPDYYRYLIGDCSSDLGAETCE